MHGTFIVASVLLLIQLSSINSFQFTVRKNITYRKNLNSKFWSFVEIIDDCNEETIAVNVKVPIILSPDYPPVTLFIANEVKNILQIDLNESIKGTEYSLPYRVKNKMNGKNTIRNTSSEFYLISGEFPRTWMPHNSTKISATVHGDDGTYFNYYALLHPKISMLDLMVVEEYLNYNCGS